MDLEAVQRYYQAIRDDGRYAPSAFEFVREGLEHATCMFHGPAIVANPTCGDRQSPPRHIGGGQLCEALRDLAQQRWGALAALVLRNWNIHCTRDFGEIVFLLINLGMLGKQPSDCIEDFDDVYDFAAYDDYEIRLGTLDEQMHESP